MMKPGFFFFGGGGGKLPYIMDGVDCGRGLKYFAPLRGINFNTTHTDTDVSRLVGYTL